MLFSAARDLDTCVSIVQAAGAPNVVVLADSLHLERSGGQPDDLRRYPASLFPYAQVCGAQGAGAAADAEAARAEGVKARLMPDEGDLPVAAFIRGPAAHDDPERRGAAGRTGRSGRPRRPGRGHAGVGASGRGGVGRVTDSRAEELRIDGLVNVRDLGGLRTHDGRTVRSRQVIRSDNPKGLTDQGQADLAEVVAPALIVDLRMVLEVAREGYTIGHDPARVVNLPMLPQSGVNQEQIDAGAADNLVEDYMRQIDVNAASVVEALRLIADPANRPVVVHCTAGKDRTGIVVAMLLDILGVAARDDRGRLPRHVGQHGSDPRADPQRPGVPGQRPGGGADVDLRVPPRDDARLPRADDHDVRGRGGVGARRRADVGRDRRAARDAARLTPVEWAVAARSPPAERAAGDHSTG